jgi:hypothetical protein
LKAEPSITAERLRDVADGKHGSDTFKGDGHRPDCSRSAPRRSRSLTPEVRQARSIFQAVAFDTLGSAAKLHPLGRKTRVASWKG